jgi:hypothetical protein
LVKSPWRQAIAPGPLNSTTPTSARSHKASLKNAITSSTLRAPGSKMNGSIVADELIDFP